MENILFFDGHCGFCDRAVQRVIRFERRSTIRFSPLQSDFSKRFFSERGIHIAVDSVVFYDRGKVFTKGKALCAVMQHLKWPYPWLGKVIQILPNLLVDAVYDLVAKNRQRLAGSSCGVPDKLTRERFLTE